VKLGQLRHLKNKSNELETKNKDKITDLYGDKT